MSESTQQVQLAAFFESCPEMLFVAGLDGRLQLASEVLRRELGPAADLGELVHPEDRAAFEAAWARLRDGREPVRGETRFRQRDGGYRVLEYHAACSADGEAIHGSLRPAARGAAAEGPSLKERLMDAIVAHLPLNVWAVDDRGTFLFHDGKGLETIGLRPGQFLGQNIFELYAGHEGLKDLRRALEGEVVHSFDYVLNTHWENWLAPVRGPGGEVAMVLCYSMDISSVRRVEEELRLRLAQLEQQQDVIRALSTPIIEVWDGVLTLPMLGVLDSVRTAEVMNSLLERVSSSGARFAILDLTGVEVVDTKVASHLIDLVTAIGLLGAEGIVAGIRSTVAQTMVSLGLDLSQITTKRNLRAALSYCIREMASTPTR